MNELIRRDWIPLRRDLILHRRTLVVVALIYTAFQTWLITGISGPTAWLVLNCIYMSVLTVVPLNVDEKSGTLPWLCTLPVTRADLVRGRYVTAWSLLVGMYTVAVGLAAFVPGSRLSPLSLLEPDYLLLAAGITTFIIALLLPFTIRFGFMGVLLTLMAMQVLGGVTFVVAKATGSMGGVEGGIASVVRALRDVILALRETMPVPVFQLAVLAFLVLLNWASYRASVALFRRREF